LKDRVLPAVLSRRACRAPPGGPRAAR
jgi:hypothetical protein